MQVASPAATRSGRRFVSPQRASAPARIPFESNTRPVLVINPMRDRMVSPTVPKHNYECLSGPKEYIEIDYGHWATGETFAAEYARIVHGYLQRQSVK